MAWEHITEEDRAELAALLRQAIGADKYPLSPRVQQPAEKRAAREPKQLAREPKQHQPRRQVKRTTNEQEDQTAPDCALETPPDLRSRFQLRHGSILSAKGLQPGWYRRRGKSARPTPDSFLPHDPIDQLAPAAGRDSRPGFYSLRLIVTPCPSRRTATLLAQRKAQPRR
jgi:hypothetical protein